MINELCTVLQMQSIAGLDATKCISRAWQMSKHSQEETCSGFPVLYEFSLHLLCNIVGKTPSPNSERWYHRYILCRSYSKCIIVSIKYVLHVYVYIYSYTCTYIHEHVQIYSHASTYSVLAWQGRVRISHWSLIAEPLTRIEAKSLYTSDWSGDLY